VALTRYDNRISLYKLEVFCLVVELGGISRAAEHLIVAQPVVSAHVQSLQKRLGVKLLYREGHRMVLTEGGERVYEWARETLSRTRELRRELDGMADGQRGSVAVAASMTVGSYLLPAPLARFRQSRPHVVITLSVADPEHATAAVEQGSCDFAVIVADEAPDNPGLEAETIGIEEIAVVVAPDYDPAVTSLPAPALGKMPMISSPAGLVRRSVIDRQLGHFGVRLENVVIELGHPEAMKRATLDGLGLCLLFRSSVEGELRSGVLREITIRDARISVPIMTVMRSDKRLSEVQRELLGTIKETF
jgi:DNA-binding transcriptional LysR family regulator